MSIELREPHSATGSFAGESKTELHLPNTSTSVSGVTHWLTEALSFASDTSQAWFWTPEWQAGEAEATAQMVAGQGEFFESGEALAQAFRERRRRNGNV